MYLSNLRGSLPDLPAAVSTNPVGDLGVNILMSSERFRTSMQRIRGWRTKFSLLRTKRLCLARFANVAFAGPPEIRMLASV